MGLFCTTTNVLDKVGVGADATLVASSAWIERIITKHEGILVATTTIDYSGGYASLGSYLKEFIRDVTASGCAKEIIEYNRRGFTIQDVEFKVDTLYDIWNKGLADLSKIERVTNIRSISSLST